MKVLVTGGTGIVGRYFLRRIMSCSNVTATYFGNKDFEWIPDIEYLHSDVNAKEDTINLVKTVKPDVIVHAASIGSVDFCEKYKDKARLVNVEGTRNMLEASGMYASKFVFISSNAVFDGENPVYKETDTPNPINHYGRLKLECEQMVMASHLEYAIARPILIYGWNDPNERENPVTWLLSRLRDGKPVKIVDNVYCTPLLAANSAEALQSIVLGDKKGIYHIGGRDRINRFDFAVKTAKAFGLDYGLIEPVPNSYFKNIAPRPKDTSYSTKKMEEELGVRPIGVDEGLEMMLSEKEVALWQK